jgi:hypothetical protein
MLAYTDYQNGIFGKRLAETLAPPHEAEIACGFVQFHPKESFDSANSQLADDVARGTQVRESGF